MILYNKLCYTILLLIFRKLLEPSNYQNHSIRYFIKSYDGYYLNLRLTLISEQKVMEFKIEYEVWEKLVKKYELKNKQNPLNDVSSDIFFNNNPFIKKALNLILFSPIKYCKFLKEVNENIFTS